MNRLNFLSMAAIASIMIFMACDKQGADNGVNGTEPDGEEFVQTAMIEAYYTGDYYESGTGNGWINFIEGELDYDDMAEEYTGNGMILCMDVNMTLPENPDFAVLDDGVYTLTDGTHAAGTWNADGDSFIVLRKDDKAELEGEVTGGTFTVKKIAGGYNIVFDLEIGEEKFEYEFTGKISFINHSEEGAQSNLKSDITVSGLTQGAMIYAGDIATTGISEVYMVILSDKDYDLEANFGQGKAVVLYLNVPAGHEDALPAGTYKNFVDLEAPEAPAWTGLQGMYYWGTYMGTYYFHNMEQIEARIVDGNVVVEKAGSEYIIDGILEDGNGKKVYFSYQGELLHGELAEDYTAAPARAANLSHKLVK